MIEVAIDKQDCAFPAFRQRSRQVQRDRRFPVARQRTRNQKAPQLASFPDGSKTHPQEPEPVGHRAMRIGVKHNAGRERDLHFLDAHTAELRRYPGGFQQRFSA
jgi:hypothetical protein